MGLCGTVAVLDVKRKFSIYFRTEKREVIHKCNIKS